MKPILLAAYLFVVTGIFAQSSLSHADSLLTGTWTGTSICQVRPSACNDEICAYHISVTGKPGIYHMIMNKMINGKEEDMGVSDYIYNAAAGTLIAREEKYKIIVAFRVTGYHMEGTLKRFDDDTVLRIIRLDKKP